MSAGGSGQEIAQVESDGWSHGGEVRLAAEDQIRSDTAAPEQQVRLGACVSHMTQGFDRTRWSKSMILH